MNQRDRYWATFIVWVVFIVLAFLAIDRLLILPVDFTGLWPQQSGVYPMAQDAEQIIQAIESAREASPAIFAQVQDAIRTHYAYRVPLVFGLTIMMVIAATFCTYFIWRNAGIEAYLAREAVQAEKVKRRSRIDQFMEDLDSDEMHQLRARLADEGEIKANR